MKKYIIYVSIPKKNIIQVLKIKKKKIKEVQKIYTNGEVQPLKISYKKKLIYAGVRNFSRILTYQIKNTGLLKIVKETKTYGNPNHISLDKNEKYLFNSSYSGNCVTCHKLDIKGFPKKIYKIKNNILGCHSSIFNKNLNILFFTSLKEDKIYFEKIKNISKIFQNTFSFKSKKNSGPRHMDIHPNQKYLYVLNELNNTISIWNIKNILKKKFLPIQIIDILPKFFGKKWAADIHISPCGNFLYTCERTSNTISLFKINQKTGILKFIKIYHTETQPRSFNIDKKGKYLIISGQKSNSISIYKINKKLGLLKKIINFQTEIEPLWIEIISLNL